MASSPSTCYFPNGDIAYNYSPCNESATDSWCCTTTDFCLNNGHCIQETNNYPNRISRGSCTDRSWNSKACPFECADVKTYEDLTLILAYESDQPDSPFCCNKLYNTETQACEVSSQGSFQPFQLPIGRIVYNRTDGSAMMNGTLPSSLFQQNACEAQTASTQNQTIQTLEPTTCPQTPAQAESANVTAIAAGIAAPLGVLLLASLAAVAVLFRQNRSLKRLAQHGSLAHGLPTAQAGNDGWQGAHVHSPAKEMPSEGAAIESGGRPAAQELPARGLGD